MGHLAEDLLERAAARRRFELLGRAVGDQVAAIENQDARAHPLDHVEDVRAVEDRPALGGERGQQTLGQRGGIGVEAGQRLVEDDQQGIVQQGGSDQHFLPHAFGVGAEPLIALVGQAERVDHRVDPGLQPAFLDLVSRPRSSRNSWALSVSYSSAASGT